MTKFPSNITKNLVCGAISGALGGLVMKIIVNVADRQSFGLSSRTDAKTAHEIWRKMGWTGLTEPQAERVGAAMHYAFSAAAGAAYAGISTKWPAIRAGRGTAFGAAVWLVGDEVAVTALGLEDPRRTPALSHLSALGAHLAYGILVDSI